MGEAGNFIINRYGSEYCSIRKCIDEKKIESRLITVENIKRLIQVNPYKFTPKLSPENVYERYIMAMNEFSAKGETIWSPPANQHDVFDYDTRIHFKNLIQYDVYQAKASQRTTYHITLNMIKDQL